MATTVTPPGTAAQPLNSPDHATWAGQVYADLRSLDTAIAATGQPVQITHPNTDDVLVRGWDTGKSRWQTIHYDSGWRDVASMLSDGWVQPAGPPTLRVRRLGGVLWYGGYIDGTAKTADYFTTAFPVGWHPSGAAYGLVLSAANEPRVVGVSAGRLYIAGAAPRQYYMSCSVQTDDALPTSLPGSLIASAPS